MRIETVQRKYRIQVAESDRQQLPEPLREVLGEGDWLVTVEPADDGTLLRDHSSLLSGYAPEDEGLYDDLAPTG
ncbi:MAG: hypothetical protein WD557_14235 [Dehalococcoidia bacterium]